MISHDISLYLAAVKLQVEPVTVENYRIRLEKFVEFAGSRHVDQPLVLSYRRHLLAKKLARSSIAVHLSTLRTFFGWLSENGHISKNPVPKVRADEYQSSRPRKTGISQEEYILILKAATAHWVYATQVGWATGMRLADVATLKSVAVNPDEMFIETIPRKTRKTGRSIQIPISVALANYLHQHLGGEFVCPEMEKSYRLHGHHSLSAQFCNLARSVGVPKGFHKFRDSFMTRLISQNVNPAIVAEMCGVSINRVLTYCHTPLDVKRAAIGKIIELDAA